MWQPILSKLSETGYDNKMNLHYDGVGQSTNMTEESSLPLQKAKYLWVHPQGKMAGTSNCALTKIFCVQVSGVGMEYNL